jgi:carboxypeptidase family protein
VALPLLSRRLVVPLLVLLALLLGSVRPATAQQGLPAWDTVPTPNAGTGDNALNGIDALTPSDIWAVGYSDLAEQQPLVERFDGNAWSIVPTPHAAASFLYAVKTLAADDAWAVGGYESTGKSLIEHWDGSAWSIVSNPNRGTFNQLYAIDGTGPNDVWAVGEYAHGVSSTLVQHWDGSAWTIVPSPNGDPGYNKLYGVTAIAPDDVWAVGVDGSYRSLTLHWDGAAWTEIPSPSKGEQTTFLAVSANEADDVWAVGYSLNGTATAHWDGSAWTLVPSPSPGQFYERLSAVEAIASDDVWAAGVYSTGPAYVTLVEHWDGATWSVVGSPSPGAYSELHGITATGPSDVQAVGESDGTLIEHWNGSSLSIVPSPNEGTGRNELHGVQALAPNDVWAVGITEQDTLIEHWDGTSFAIVPSPNRTGRTNVLEGVDGTSATDVWAVGHADVTGFVGSRSLIEHWNGARWQIVPSPNFGRQTDQNDLMDVAAITPNQVWAVGTFESTSSFRSIILRWNGSRWRAARNNCGFGLTGIDARSATDIWAVGGSDTCHWDGTTWTHFPAGPTPNPQVYVDLIDVTVVSAADAWAVGQEISECGEQVCFSGEIQHWNGSTWTHVLNSLAIGYGVDAVAADDVWAVGPGPEILHYDGREWSTAPVPDLDAEYGDLNDVEGSAATDLWAVGFQSVGEPKTLAMHAPSATSGAVEGGTNVGGATVSWFGSESGSVQTDPFGDYQVGGLTAGTYRFVVTYAGCDPATKRVTVVAGTTIVVNFQLSC